MSANGCMGYRFNWAARKVHKRLTQLGASEIYARGEADEQNSEGFVFLLQLWHYRSTKLGSPSIDATFLPWWQGLRARLLDLYPLPEGLLPIPANELIRPRWALTLVEQRGECSESSPPTSASTSAVNGAEESALKCNLLPRPNSIAVTLTQNVRVTPQDHWQDVRHLAFTSQSPIEYGPGDVLTVYPNNFPDDVQQFISMMDWEDIADRSVAFVPTSPKSDLNTYPPCPVQTLSPPSKWTIRSLLTHHFDITSIPRRSFFSFAAHFTSDAFHKERLLEFTDPEHLDELYDYTTRPRRSILEVLHEFDSVKLPWQWIGAVLPILRGRQFSIASGGPLKNVDVDNSNSGSKIELLVAIVKYQTVIRKIRQGVCTRYLAALPPGTSLNVVVQRGGLDVSRSEASRPVILVGPGTGVAPLRSMLWERYAWQLQMLYQQRSVNGSDPSGSATRVGRSLLFFGGRNRRADFFYQGDWDHLKTELNLQVFTAFSRDQVGPESHSPTD